jgi:hypothetical protein
MLHLSIKRHSVILSYYNIMSERDHIYNNYDIEKVIF